jgi:hypothetical protein
VTAAPLLLNVDDDRASQYAVSRVLRQAGYDVITAGSLTQARTLIVERRPDLVLLDVNLPDGSGLDLCAQLKAEYPGAEIMVLQHSATYSRPIDHARGLDRGADGYVTLPADPDVLLATVRSLLRAQRAERETRAVARQWDAAFHAISDAVALVDEAERVLVANRAFAAWVGRGPEEVRGHPWSSLLGDLLLPPVDATRPGPIETERQWRGHWVRQVTNTVPLTSTTSGLVCVLSDITDRKQREHERLTLLESERQARLRAEQADSAKDNFLALVSHELRTPLNAMLGWAHMLATEPGHGEDVRRAAATIERNARAQAHLIEDLLDVSRAVSGQLRLAPERVDLNDVVEGACESVAVAAVAKGVLLNIERDPGPVLVLGDPARLRQIVWNLASNAVKFTPPDGEVAVAVRLSRDGAELSVTDTGIGIEPEALPHIFKRFWHASDDTSRLAGLGLGLAIVQHLVEAHGGRIEARSAGIGQGASFVIRLPALSA